MTSIHSLIGDLRVVFVAVIALAACSSNHPAFGTPGSAGTGGAAGTLIGGSGGGAGGPGGRGRAIGGGGAIGGGDAIGGSAGGTAGATGGCTLTLQAPPTGTHVDCPLIPDCAATYADQIAKANVDGGVCAGPVAVTISDITCGAYRVWRKATFYWYEDCVYTGAGTLVGSVNCGDTGCNYAGDVIDDASCLDAGLGPNLCPTDAGPDADAGGGDDGPACMGTAGFGCVASCTTDFGPPAFPVCSNGTWICPSPSVKVSTCPCGSNLPPLPDSGCTYP